MATLPIDESDQASQETGFGSRTLRRAVPPWLVSLLLHLSIVAILAWVSVVDPKRVVYVMSVDRTPEEAPELERFLIEQSDAEETFDTSSITFSSAEIGLDVEIKSAFVTEVNVRSTESAEFENLENVASKLALRTSTLQTVSSASDTHLQGRSGEARERLLAEFGGNASSESAVNDALKWLQRHQAPNGGWTFQHHLVCQNACGDPGHPAHANSLTAATSLALLPFLGAGHTHRTGKYKDVVRRGLHFLIQRGQRDYVDGKRIVSFREPEGTLYSHGLAAIVLCEAYGMTGDSELVEPAEGALKYISWAQGNDGGWRYEPQSLVGGDTSVTGWMVMALKSGQMAGLNVKRKTMLRSMSFLDKVGSEGGAFYGYATTGREVNLSCTSIGLLCRMYLGWNRDRPQVAKGIAAISAAGLDKHHIYYMYYATQALRHFGGDQWFQLNEQTRDWLVATQSKKSGEFGSWYFDTRELMEDPKLSENRSFSELHGGRLLCTAFATMILEVYYRHMPLYADAAVEEDFPL